LKFYKFDFVCFSLIFHFAQPSNDGIEGEVAGKTVKIFIFNIARVGHLKEEGFVFIS